MKEFFEGVFALIAIVFLLSVGIFVALFPWAIACYTIYAIIKLLL